ncbi:MAG: VOC family protein [Halobacteriaceae archaeon]
MSDEHEVSATLPDSPMHTAGIDHVTIVGSNAADTVEFYRDVLGMPLVMDQINLDAPEVDHLFFDAGDGRLLTFFVEDDRPTDANPVPVDVGSVHHLAFAVEPEEFDDAKAALEGAGHHYNEFDRGAFHSLYTRDPNGLVLEFATDKYDVPDDRRGEVLARAHRERVEAGADYVRDEDLRAALEALGLPVEAVDVGEAPTGAGVDE